MGNIAGVCSVSAWLSQTIYYVVTIMLVLFNGIERAVSRLMHAQMYMRDCCWAYLCKLLLLLACSTKNGIGKGSSGVGWASIRRRASITACDQRAK